ncbi:Ig family protein [Yasminevirus sp. GU-2018]|uniref:Ig family protein n=1 Tax=Yasminevirus sp. GU-2018 TaxID=2420051 RepID=A0A5K0UAW7_9VIRU|nr:Ig family protein [Yasminevirus sp. GU-2018]
MCDRQKGCLIRFTRDCEDGCPVNRGPYCANLLIKASDAKICHVLDNVTWTLGKRGGIVGETIVWEVEVTKGVDANKKSEIRYESVVKLYNNGFKNAQIGNIVVNLQKLQPNGVWVTFASDIHDITAGNLTSPGLIGYVCKKGNSENQSKFEITSDSGDLIVYTPSPPCASTPMTASTLSVFSTVPAYSSIIIPFSATFKKPNLVAVGDRIRFETIVTYGTVPEDCSSGIIDSCDGIPYTGDEMPHNGVKSIAYYNTYTLPTAPVCNDAVILRDPSGNITSSIFGGSIQFENYNTDIGGGRGVDVNVSASGSYTVSVVPIIVGSYRNVAVIFSQTVGNYDVLTIKDSSDKCNPEKQFVYPPCCEELDITSGIAVEVKQIPL